MVIQVKLKKYRPVTINKQEHEESNIQHQKKGKSSKRQTLLEVKWLQNTAVEQQCKQKQREKGESKNRKTGSLRHMGGLTQACWNA